MGNPGQQKTHKISRPSTRAVRHTLERLVGNATGRPTAKKNSQTTRTSVALSTLPMASDATFPILFFHFAHHYVLPYYLVPNTLSFICSRQHIVCLYFLSAQEPCSLANEVTQVLEGTIDRDELPALQCIAACTIATYPLIPSVYPGTENLRHLHEVCIFIAAPASSIFRI